MPVETGDPYPNPFGFTPAKEAGEYAKCYLCDEQRAVKAMAAIPLGYFRISVDIAPTWTDDNTIKARALIGPMIPKNFRPPQLNGVPYICKACWLTCQQMDRIAHNSDVSIGAPWDEPPMFPFMR